MSWPVEFFFWLGVVAAGWVGCLVLVRLPPGMVGGFVFHAGWLLGLRGRVLWGRLHHWWTGRASTDLEYIVAPGADRDYVAAVRHRNRELLLALAAAGPSGRGELGTYVARFQAALAEQNPGDWGEALAWFRGVPVFRGDFDLANRHGIDVRFLVVVRAMWAGFDPPDRAEDKAPASVVEDLPADRHLDI